MPQSFEVPIIESTPQTYYSTHSSQRIRPAVIYVQKQHTGKTWILDCPPLRGQALQHENYQWRHPCEAVLSTAGIDTTDLRLNLNVVTRERSECKRSHLSR
jgi:hypothetical protein